MSITPPRSGAQVHFTGRTALTTYSSGTRAAKIFEPTSACNLLGLGNYTGTTSISNAVNTGLDAIAIDAGVRLIIYSGANNSGSIILDAVGPKVIYNDYVMKYNEQDDDGNQGHSDYIGMMLDEPHEGTFNRVLREGLTLENQLSDLRTGWDTTVMDPSGSGQTLSARFPSPTANLNGIEGARVRSFEYGYYPSNIDNPIRPGARMDHWQIGSFQIMSAGASASGTVDVIVRGMDASHNTLATDTEATTFDSSKYYRVNVNAIGVDHWGWRIDKYAGENSTETMMPAGSTYFTINGADYQASGGTSGGSTSVPLAYTTAQQACDPNANLDGYLYDENHYVIRYAAVQRSGSFTARGQVYEFYCYGSASSFVTNAPNFTPFYTLQAETLSLFNTSICVGWAAWQYSAQISTEMAAFGLVYDGAKNSILQHTLDTAYIAGSNLASSQNYREYIHPQNCSTSNNLDGYDTNSAASGGNGVVVVNNGGLTSHIEALQVTAGTDLEQISIYPIKKITSSTPSTPSTFDTSDRSLWGGTNYPKLDIFYAHGHGGTYNGYGTGYTKTFVNWRQGYGPHSGQLDQWSWMWTHTGHTGAIYGSRKIKGRWLGDASGLGDDDGTPVYPGYNFGYWAQPFVNPPADGIYPDGSTRPHPNNISSSSHANITYGYDSSNYGNPAPVTDSNGVMTWERAMMGPISDIMEYDVTIGNQNIIGYNATFRGITFAERVGFGLRSTSWDEGSDGESQGTTFRGAAFLVVGFQDDAGVWHYKDEYL